MSTMNQEQVKEKIAPEDVNIYYIIVKRKESDEAIFEHRFDSSTIPIPPPHRLREAVRTLSAEISPLETSYQIIKRGDLPFLLVWSENLGAVAAVTRYTPTLKASCQQILEFFEMTYPDVVKEGGDLSGHVPTVEHIKDALMPALLQVQSPPPPVQILAYESTNYYFSSTTNQIGEFTSIYAESKGFQRLLDREKIETAQIVTILITLKDTLVSLKELSEQFKVSTKKLAGVLRHLNLFELVSLYSTPL